MATTVTEPTTDDKPLTFTEVLAREVAQFQNAMPAKRADYANAQLAILEGCVRPIDLAAGEGEVLSSRLTHWYVVNGACCCKAADYGKICRHLQAWRLYKHVAKVYAEHRSPVDEPDPAPETDVHPRIPPQFLRRVHGKDFVLYAGLLAMAHAEGLVTLGAGFISVTDTLALAWAKATFTDGRAFTEAADATPSNVGEQVDEHFARVALTRAKARALRDALNIGMCAVEELK